MKATNLEQIQRLAVGLDYLEEDAEDFLADRGIALISHSRSVIIQQAWQAGWHPAGFSRSDATAA